MPSTMEEWRVKPGSDFDGLTFNDSAPVPKLGDNDVLVRFRASSLNYRDLIIAKGTYPFPVGDNVVPASDGAGTVEAVGSRVSRFQKGDNVCVIFNAGHIAGSLDFNIIKTGVGGCIDGALRQYGAYNEESLVHMPSNLNYVEAATLTCAGVTAWNALYGLEGRSLRAGDWVLTQGTGGVSIFALQFAKAAGARVISTTSSAAKGERLKHLGADHVINYRDDPNWGETAKTLTRGRGMQHVVEVGGPTTLKQSLNAIAIDGLISIIGFVGGAGEENPPSFSDCLNHLCTVRGLVVGSRLQFEEMNRSIEANDIKPFVHEKVFSLHEVKEAYQYMWEQKHFGKLAITID